MGEKEPLRLSRVLDCRPYSIAELSCTGSVPIL